MAIDPMLHRSDPTATRRASIRRLLPLLCAALAGCAAPAPRNGAATAQFHLFDAAGIPHFSFYFACAGATSAETEMCWVPSKYFFDWAGERHVPARELRASRFDPASGFAGLEPVRGESAVEHRVVVQFEPIALASYTAESDGIGGYTPPKVGYQAYIYVYAAADGKLVYQTTLRRKTDAPFKADAVPYIKAGVQAAIAALDPHAGS